MKTQDRLFTTEEVREMFKNLAREAVQEEIQNIFSLPPKKKLTKKEQKAELARQFTAQAHIKYIKKRKAG